MKRTMITLAMVSTLIAGTVFTGCNPSTAKVEVAQENVQDAKQELKEAQKDATAEEWKAFKDESNVKIKDNENRIAELKAKMKRSGNKLDALYGKKIAELEQKNIELKARIDTYETSAHSNWESFKLEFNHDMDELGKAMKDLTVNNTK